MKKKGLPSGGVNHFVSSLRSRNGRGAVHTVEQELWQVVVFVAAIWGVFLLDLVLPLEQFGLVPRRWMGLIGIATMTFLHANLNHLVSNSIPLFVLLTLLAGSRARSWQIVFFIVVLGGTLLWLFGRTAVHIGASLLIFGLIAFLISSGLVFERRPVPVIIALIVGVMYGATLMIGIVPHPGSSRAISWDGHLAGAVAGVLVARSLARAASNPRFASE